jgi:hypothetical protein
VTDIIAIFIRVIDDHILAIDEGAPHQTNKPSKIAMLHFFLFSHSDCESEIAEALSQAIQVRGTAVKTVTVVQKWVSGTP